MTEEKDSRTDRNPENPMVKKRIFGRGIYGSKDVPIRMLDGLIGVLIAVIVVMIAYFAINGGFAVQFDSRGGTEVAQQKVRHGQKAAEPEAPERPGYEFAGWYTDADGAFAWNFDTSTVEGDITLCAKWTPAQIAVKLDPAGGSFAEGADVKTVYVTYGEAYGALPEPERDGYRFTGWLYSGNIITAETSVAVNGEHVLTAVWEDV